jgi:hypothetical protein
MPSIRQKRSERRQKATVEPQGQCSPNNISDQELEGAKHVVTPHSEVECDGRRDNSGTSGAGNGSIYYSINASMLSFVLAFTQLAFTQLVLKLVVCGLV